MLVIAFARSNAALVLVTFSSILFTSRKTPMILTLPLLRRNGTRRSARPGCHHFHGLRHLRSNAPVFLLWNKIRSLRRSANAPLRHKAWLEFLSIRKSPSESYTEYPIRLDAAYAKIERITPENQTSAQCSEELSVFWSSI